MELLGNGFVTLLNGVLELLDVVTSPVIVAGGLFVAAMGWLALIELDELNRQGRKPELGRGM